MDITNILEGKMRPESTRCPLMTKDPVHPTLCWEEFCEFYDEDAKCCSVRLIAIRLGQVFGVLVKNTGEAEKEKKSP